MRYMAAAVLGVLLGLFLHGWAHDQEREDAVRAAEGYLKPPIA